MKTYWHIVPVGDGYSYLGFKNGQHIKCSKETSDLDISLLFENRESCKQYIKDNLDIKEYNEEAIALNEKYYKFK